MNDMMEAKSNIDTIGDEVDEIESMEIDGSARSAMYISEMTSILSSKDEIFDGAVLRLTSKIYPGRQDKSIDAILKAILEESISIEFRRNFSNTLIKVIRHYMDNVNVYPPYQKSLPLFIKVIRNGWSNSRTKEKNIIELKSTLKDIISKALNTNRLNTMTNYSTFIFMYLSILVVIKVDKEG